MAIIAVFIQQGFLLLNYDSASKVENGSHLSDFTRSNSACSQKLRFGSLFGSVLAKTIQIHLLQI